MKDSDSEFQTALGDNAKQVTDMLDALMPLTDTPEARVVEAMRYASLAGGKRVRPFLVTQSASLFGVDTTSALRAAAAVEMVHCYSLVHDDLPAMDDDDLRRGQPTCHIKFDEATAILAGDALLTKAFEVLAAPETHSDARVRADLVLALAKAAGDHGMVGGQMMDLWAEDNDLDVAQITRLQRMKTGDLIAVSAEAGAILGRASDEARSALTSVWRSRSPTICWTSKAMRRWSARRPARMRTPTRRPSCPCWGWTRHVSRRRCSASRRRDTLKCLVKRAAFSSNWRDSSLNGAPDPT